MQDYTLEAWCNPTDLLPGVADHTFVWCPDTKKLFGCWAGGNISDSKSAKVLTGRWKNAESVANCYRTPMWYAGAERPDTAAVGAYLINGVCHQSANLFMFASTHEWITLRWVTENSGNSGLRPMGLPVSYAAYGPRGAVSPGGLPHWLVWYFSTYKPCADRVGVASSEQDERLQAVLDRLPVKLDPDTVLSEEDNRRLIVAEFAAFVEESQPTIMQAMGLESAEPVSTDRFAGVHMDFLREKDHLLSADYKAGDAASAEALAQRINDMTIEFQKQLESTLGGQGYTQVTGLEPGHQVSIADPQIAHMVNRPR